MTSINTQATTSYYSSLSAKKAPGLTGDGSASLTEILTQNNNSYLLNLSPKAQAYLTRNNLNNLNSSKSLTLNATQQKEINAILTKYKDAPYSQATFTKIQADLKSAGLDNATLSAKEQINSFNPTQLLMGFLSAPKGGRAF